MTDKYIAIDSIIEVSYPYDGQVNFLKDEFVRESGYILLKNSFHEVFDSELAIRWINEEGRTIENEANIDYINSTITFELPKNFFKPGKIYRYQILKLPQNHQHNSFCQYDILDQALSSILLEFLPEQSFDGEVIYGAKFRCSIFKSFINKIDFDINQNYFLDENLRIAFDLREPFSNFEFCGDDIFKPQIEIRTQINSNIGNLNGLYSNELKRILSTRVDLLVDTLDMNESMESLLQKYNEINTDEENNSHRVDYLNKFDLNGAEFNCKTIKSNNIEEYLAKNKHDDSYSCEITFPMLDSLSNIYRKAQQELKNRIEERAVYFRLIDIKIKKLEKNPIRLPLKYYKDIEYAKLSLDLKELINQNMQLENDKKCFLNIIYRLPGIDIKTTVIELKFDLYEK